MSHVSLWLIQANGSLNQIYDSEDCERGWHQVFQDAMPFIEPFWRQFQEAGLPCWLVPMFASDNEAYRSYLGGLHEIIKKDGQLTYRQNVKPFAAKFVHRWPPK